MVARLTRALLLIQFVLALLIAFAAARAWNLPGFAAVSFGLLFVIAVRAAITANNFRLAARVPCDPPARPLGWRRALKLYLSELRATLVSSSWTMPFRQVPPAGGLDNGNDCLPVLLIHGYGCNSGYWWPLSRALRKAGIAHRAVDLEPVFCGIDAYGPQVTNAIDALCKESRQARIIIVAHSMGGLVASAWLRQHGADRIARVITLGTPYGGTALAQFGIGENSRQMRRSAHGGQGKTGCSDWLAALNAGEDEAVPVVSIYSQHDNIIAPPTSSHLACARNIVFSGIGHVALGSHPAVMQCVLAEIGATGSGSGSDLDPLETVLLTGDHDRGHVGIHDGA